MQSYSTDIVVETETAVMFAMTNNIKDKCVTQSGTRVFNFNKRGKYLINFTASAASTERIVFQLVHDGNLVHYAKTMVSGLGEGVYQQIGFTAIIQADESSFITIMNMGKSASLYTTSICITKID